MSKNYLAMSNIYHNVMEGDDTAEISAKVFEWAKNGNSEALRKHRVHLGVRDSVDASPLHHATAGGHDDTIRSIVEVIGLQDLNNVDMEGNTPLHWAVQKRQRQSCVCLMDLGADPNLLNNQSMSPLHLAVNLQYNDLVETLLSYGTTDADLAGDLGNTPVMMACSVDNHEALKILYKHNAKLCQQNKLGHYPIHTAAFNGARRSVEVVLQKGEELGYAIETHINCVDKYFCSPLHLAVRGGNLDVIRLLIEMGSCIDQQQSDNSTALHCACTQGSIEAVKLMLSSYTKGCDVINIRDGANQTPLHKATLFDHNDLAEYLISKGADVNAIDCKGHTPLLLASSCRAWRTIKVLLSNGADLQTRDECGRNFLHLVMLQPKGLKNLTLGVLQLCNVKELLHAEDHEGCTPLHYACRLGVLDSVNNMLGLNVSLEQKSKRKKSALHFAAEYGRINTCQRLLDSTTDTRLLNDGDERGMTPLHLASHGGHVQVVELLLRRGALFHSDYQGRTSLHYAALEGYTKTISTLITSDLKLLDRADEDGNTALHLCARKGHTRAVLLLLGRGAQMTINKMDASFLHEAVLNGRKETCDAVVKSDRCIEAMYAFNPESSHRRHVTRDMIEMLPEAFKTLLDTCMKESEEDINSTNYSVSYDFRWLQAPVKVMKNRPTKEYKIQKIKPLASLNTLVQFNRVELLTHPVCRQYLDMKWRAYGVIVHMLNLWCYCMGLVPLTYLIINLRPVFLKGSNNSSNSSNPRTLGTTSLDKQPYMISVCMFLVVAMNLYAVCKELVQIVQQRWGYFCDVSNLLDWTASVSSLVFVIPLLLKSKKLWPWEAGSVAVLISWINFLFYLQRFESVGIYVVMFRQISKTLLCIVVLFFFLILAFALAFYAVVATQVKGFEDSLMFLSLMETFMMMVGEFSYQTNIRDPYTRGELPFPIATFVIFTWFILLVPILLMNLMIGLAVGDIAAVQNNAVLKQIAMQIDLHTNLEKKLPYWLLKRVDQDSITIYPNKSKGQRLLSYLGGETKQSFSFTSQEVLPLEREVRKQKNRLREITCMQEKQLQLLKLILQKMDISLDLEECDGPQDYSHID